MQAVEMGTWWRKEDDSSFRFHLTGSLLFLLGHEFHEQVSSHPQRERGGWACIATSRKDPRIFLSFLAVMLSFMAAAYHKQQIREECFSYRHHRRSQLPFSSRYKSA